MVIRPTDAESGTFNCARATSEPTTPSSNYKMARNLLKKGDWYIDIANKCIVPKNYGGCYGGANNFTVEYNKANLCGGTTGKECPHFVSICYLQ
jgi:hypothetical protein